MNNSAHIERLTNIISKLKLNNDVESYIQIYKIKKIIKRLNEVKEKKKLGIKFNVNFSYVETIIVPRWIDKNKYIFNHIENKILLQNGELVDYKPMGCN